MTEDELSNKIIGCAIEVHRCLGPGLLESAYKECLYYELKQLDLQIEKEKPMPVVYKIRSWLSNRFAGGTESSD